MQNIAAPGPGQQAAPGPGQQAAPGPGQQAAPRPGQAVPAVPARDGGRQGASASSAPGPRKRTFMQAMQQSKSSTQGGAAAERGRGEPQKKMCRLCKLIDGRDVGIANGHYAQCRYYNGTMPRERVDGLRSQATGGRLSLDKLRITSNRLQAKGGRGLTKK